MRRRYMSRHLLRTAMALSIVAAALSFTGTVRAQDTSASTNAPAATPKPKRHQFTGVVEAISEKQGSVIVKKDAESKNFKIGEKTRFATGDKKEAAIGDVKVGDKVTVVYVEDEGVLKAHKISVITGAAK
jgi:Cu/Ag efflux protein CusF